MKKSLWLLPILFVSSLSLANYSQYYLKVQNETDSVLTVKPVPESAIDCTHYNMEKGVPHDVPAKTTSGYYHWSRYAGWCDGKNFKVHYQVSQAVGGKTKVGDFRVTCSNSDSCWGDSIAGIYGAVLKTGNKFTLLVHALTH